MFNVKITKSFSWDRHLFLVVPLDIYAFAIFWMTLDRLPELLIHYRIVASKRNTLSKIFVLEIDSLALHLNIGEIHYQDYKQDQISISPKSPRLPHNNICVEIRFLDGNPNIEFSNILQTMTRPPLETSKIISFTNVPTF